LGFHEPFFYKLVDVLADTMGEVFPEVRARQPHVRDVIRAEEEAFNKTLDKGIALFNEEVGQLMSRGAPGGPISQISGAFAFRLYDEQGFPLDLTELMARERGLTVDVAGFHRLMDEQRERARKAQKKSVIELAQFDTDTPTRFLGFDFLETEAVVEAVLPGKKPNEFNVVLDRTPCYAEMGGQVGDVGVMHVPGHDWSEVGRLQVLDTQKQGAVFVHRTALAEGRPPESGEAVRVAVDAARRNAIQRHHTVTHLLHWALHEVVSRDASQKGSFVGPDKLTFDFNSAPLTPVQVADIEKLVNERILENAGVSWTEVPYADVKSRKEVMQFFGEKYGEVVRVVQVGGHPGALDGYSMELCGGTHTRATGEIGLFRIVGESAIAAGVRRIEAVAGLEAYREANQQLQLIRSMAGKLNTPVAALERKIEALIEQEKGLERDLKAARQREASNVGSNLKAHAKPINGIPAIVHNVGEVDGEFLQLVADGLKGNFKGVIVLGGCANGAVSLVAAVTPEFTARVQAGTLIKHIAPIVGGKGGGRPDNARGGGKDANRLDQALEEARSLIEG
jgi:alanyl-tRNA synthetase